ncbi:MAG: hypothetical protein KDC05_16145, partial [Bacteroidales bacterium]|nr:hypothetical protein [Bacteroidales bacterium]
MKPILLISFLFFPVFFAVVNAQWILDPDNPMPVCEAEGLESEITVFGDENDGIYVFWLDSRNTAGTGSSEIYGQHYNSSGYAQWETDGRLIVSHYNRIFDYTIQRFDDGTMIAGWASKSDGYTYSDSLHVRKLDDDGLAVWANDLLIANAGFEPNAILSVGEMQFVKDDFSYCMAFYITYYGGSGGVHMSRFDESGSLLSPPDGVQVAGPGGVGHAGLLPAFDLNNNVYLFYSGGNGAGAPLNCVKLNTSGGVVWGPENVIDGTTGLAYQFDAISDPDGITFVWEGSGNNTDLFTCRFNADGTQGWNGNVFPISDVEGQQTIFDLHKSGNYYFITWSDGRPGVDPGNYDIYAQIFGMDGNMMWADDGIPVMSFNTYIPHPKMGVTPDNSLVIAHQSTVAGYTAQKVM